MFLVVSRLDFYFGFEQPFFCMPNFPCAPEKSGALKEIYPPLSLFAVFAVSACLM